MGSSSYFTEIFQNLNDIEREEFYKTVFLNMGSQYAMETRVQYYKGLLKQMGANVKIGCGVKIVNPQYISIGNDVRIGDGCTLVAAGEGGITLEDGVELKDRVFLDTECTGEGYIKIGKRTYIGTGCCLHGHMGLEIGDDCLLAQNITITPYSHKFDDRDKLISSQGGNTRKVTIGRDCYIGKNCCIVYSADVMEGSVVGSGSVVVRTIPPYSVAVGVPARVIKQRGEVK